MIINCMRQLIASESKFLDDSSAMKNTRDLCLPTNNAITFVSLLNTLISKKVNDLQLDLTCPELVDRPNISLDNMMNTPLFRNRSKTDQHPSISRQTFQDNMSISKENNDSSKIMKRSNSNKKQSKQNSNIKTKSLFDKLKRLKFLRLKRKKEHQTKFKIENHLQEHFPTTYSQQKFLTGPEISVKGTLDYLEGFVNSASRAHKKEYLEEALSSYTKLCDIYTDSSRILIQKADTHAMLFQLSQSSSHFEESISALNRIIRNPNVSFQHFKTAAEKAVSLFEENGSLSKAIEIQMRLAEKFPSIDTLNKLGNLLRFANNLSAAKVVFLKVLEIDPNNLIALVTLGNICYHDVTNGKTKPSEKSLNEHTFSDLMECVDLMKYVIETYDPNVRKSFFFYTYGDALRRLGRNEESNAIFRTGVKEGLFLNFWQRSSNFIPSLRSNPIWTVKESKIGYILKDIRKHWKVIRNEAKRIYNQQLFSKHPEDLRDKGGWSVFKLFEFAKRSASNCLLAPVTCSLMENIPHIADNVKGIVVFSMMEAGTHVHPHSGSSNCRLRVHLGLDVPKPHNASKMEPHSISRLRVKDEYLYWRNGKMFVWDDSFDHEVWHFHPLNQSRLILIFDILHPDLTENQIAAL